MLKYFKGGCYFCYIFTISHHVPICFVSFRKLFHVLCYGNSHRLFQGCLCLMQALDDVLVLLHDGQRAVSSYALHSHCTHWYPHEHYHCACTLGTHSCHASLLVHVYSSTHHCHRTYASVVWFCIPSLIITPHLQRLHFNPSLVLAFRSVYCSVYPHDIHLNCTTFFGFFSSKNDSISLLIKLISASFFALRVVLSANASTSLITCSNFSTSTYSLSSSALIAEKIVPITIAFSSLVSRIYPHSLLLM
ncbi:HNH endonuclease [Bacillus thuringiensis MC28]|nr:HNH endonuclease [Bacillus thuringiensis MC28]